MAAFFLFLPIKYFNWKFLMEDICKVHGIFLPCTNFFPLGIYPPPPGLLHVVFVVKIHRNISMEIVHAPLRIFLRNNDKQMKYYQVSGEKNLYGKISPRNCATFMHRMKRVCEKQILKYKRRVKNIIFRWWWGWGMAFWTKYTIHWTLGWDNKDQRQDAHWPRFPS